MKTYKRMADKLNQARTMVEGARKPEPAQALAAFGYPEGNLAEGQRHQQTAERAYLRAQQQEGDLVRVRQELKVAVGRAYRRYMDNLALARMAFPENLEARQRLGVSGRRRLDRTGWLRQAVDFYQHASEDAHIQQVFAGQGINLAAAQAELDEALRLRGELKRMRGEAALARRERDESFLRMERWLKVFAVTARMAFDRSRGLLEQLGL